MRVDDFDFDLPEALIARHPPERRRDARLLALTVDALKHQRFPDLADHLRPGDLLVFNDTRVMAARLYGRGDGLGSAPTLLGG